MNVIKQIADDFFDKTLIKQTDHEYFLILVKQSMESYDNVLFKEIFLERIIIRLKLNFDSHLVFCTERENGSCRFIKFYETVLFFLSHQLLKLEKSLPKKDINSSERKQTYRKVRDILQSSKLVELNNKHNHSVLLQETKELKEFYYLDKKHWRQLLIGKIVELYGIKTINKTTNNELMKVTDEIYAVFISKN